MSEDLVRIVIKTIKRKKELVHFFVKELEQGSKKDIIMANKFRKILIEEHSNLILNETDENSIKAAANSIVSLIKEKNADEIISQYVC
jgi:hypothetical protein